MISRRFLANRTRRNVPTRRSHVVPCTARAESMVPRKSTRRMCTIRIKLYWFRSHAAAGVARGRPRGNLIDSALYPLKWSMTGWPPRTSTVPQFFSDHLDNKTITRMPVKQCPVCLAHLKSGPSRKSWLKAFERHNREEAHFACIQCGAAIGSQNNLVAVRAFIFPWCASAN